MNKYERVICAIAVAILLTLLLVVFISFENENQNDKASGNELAYKDAVNLWSGEMGMIRMVEAWAIEETAEGLLLEDREGNQLVVTDLTIGVE